MRLGLTAAVCLALAAIGCSRTPPRRPDVVRVVIDQVAFQQPVVQAHVGDTIEWVNKDLFAHTSTSREGAWDLAIDVKKSGQAVMTRAGTFDYFCRLHPNMTGKVTVEP